MHFGLQVIAVCQDQQCLSQWVVIVFVRIPPFHAWKRSVKRLDGKQVHHLLTIHFSDILQFEIDCFLFIFSSNWTLSTSVDNSDLPDYYFRDSSSESGYTTNYDALRMGPNRLHHNHNTTDNFTFQLHHNNTANSSTSMVHQPNAVNSAKNMKKFSILHAFIPSFIFVIVVLVIGTVIVLESESDNFVTFKNYPEMMSLNYQYYQPFKDFLLRRLGLKSWVCGSHQY